VAAAYGQHQNLESNQDEGEAQLLVKVLMRIPILLSLAF
jgi:hypothetical protein